MKPNMRSFFTLSLFILLCAFGSANANSYTVTNLNDAGTGSLRQAILDANGNAGADIIDATGVNGTISLSTGELMISDDVTINGPGANLLSVSGNNSSRVFNISGGVTVTINSLTVTGANDGGIFVDGSILNLNNSAVSNNSAYAGGGIYCSEGELHLANSTVSGNSAVAGGGGIFMTRNFIGGILTLTNSTVSGNSVTGVSAGGGGILLYLSNATLINSTLSNNSGGPSPGGGIFNQGLVTLINSIVANSTGGDIYNLGGSVNAEYSLIEDGLGSVTGTNSNNLTGDPLLGLLANTGGPTPTHALLTGSPAIDKGSAVAGITTDQRGSTRPVDISSIANASGGDGSDIGAYEASAVSVTVTTSPSGLSFVVDGTTYTSSQTFQWLRGSPHTISTSSPQGVVVNTQQYVFDNWSDAGAISHNIIAPLSATTYTASFKTQYYLTVNPATGGSIGPSSGFFDAGTNVSLIAIPDGGYVFTNYTGGPVANPSSASTTVFMDGPKTVTAVFTLVPPTCTLTCPANISVNNTLNKCGANVTYPAATTTGSCGTLTYSKASGSFFPVGTTTVTVTSASTGASCTFTVEVKDLQKPVIGWPDCDGDEDALEDITVGTAAGSCDAVVNFRLHATDNCSVATLTSSPASGTVFPLGTTTVTVTATDPSGNTSTTTFKVTVKDRRAPVITCPPNKTVDAATGLCSASVTTGTATATDNCTANGSITIAGTRSDNKLLSDPYPAGLTRITWKAKDAAGNISTCEQRITVNDKQPPVITGVSASPSALWPADRSLKTVTVNYTVTDNCGYTSSQLSVTSNQPVSGTGYGTLSPDWQILDDHRVKLRAEAYISNRIYTIKITSKDAAGNSSVQTVTVTVPLTAPVTKTGSSTNRSGLAPTGENEISAGLMAEVMPNPSAGAFNVLIKSSINEKVEIRVYDITGRQVQMMRSAPTGVVRFGDKLVQGTYIVEVRQGKDKVVLKAVKQ
jgi:hypothetical protein